MSPITAIYILEGQALPAFAGSVLGLLGSPLARGPLLAGLIAGRTVGHHEQSKNWRLVCQVVPTVRIPKPTIWIGTQSVCTSVIEKSVDIEASDAVSWLDWTVSSPWDVTIAREYERTSPAKFRLTVRSSGKLSRRHVEDVVRITPWNRQNEKLPGREVKIVGDIVDDVIPSPSEVHFGRQPCGTVGEETIVLRSLTKRRFRVSPWSGSGDLKVVRGKGNDEACTYSLRLLFASTGDQQTNAVFKILDQDGIEYTITLPVRYYGDRRTSE